MKKKYVIISILTTVVLVIFYYPIKIDNSYDCIEFKRFDDEYKEIKVLINGSLHRRLFKKDIVKLNMTIGEDKVPELRHHKFILPYNHGKIIDYGDGNMRFNSNNYLYQKVIEYRGYHMVFLSYSYLNDKSLDSFGYEDYGKLYLSKDFKNIIIGVHNAVEKDNGGTVYKVSKMIVSNTNKQYADKMVKQLSSKTIE